MGVRYQKYRSIAIPLNIGIELSQVSRYFDISNIEPALVHISVVYFRLICKLKTLLFEQISAHLNPFYPEYDSSRSYLFYPEYDSGRSLHLTRLPCTLTFWNPIGWLTPNDVSISGSLGNSYFSTNQRRSLGICSTKRVPPS